MGSELDMTEVMDTWTLQMGFPVVEISIPETGKLKASPKRFMDNPKSDPTQPVSEFK